MKSVLWLLVFWVGMSDAPFLHAANPATPSGDESALFPPQTQQPPLTLEECFKLALDQSETVAIQKEAIARATAQIFNATSQALGDVDFIATRELQDTQKEFSGSSSTSIFNDQDTSQRKFVISQPLFQGFKAMGALTGAGSFRKEQKEAYRRAKELLYQDVAYAFYGILRYQNELKIIRDVHDLLKARIKELEERERIGRSRPSEVATAVTSLKSLEADLAAVKGSLSTVQFILEYLIGMELQGRPLQDNSMQDPSSRKLQDYLSFAEARSDVRAAQEAVKTAKSGILVAQSGFWPTINLNHTQYTRREGSLSNVDWDLLFTVDVPLFSGTATIGQLKDSIGLFKQQKLSFSRAKRQAELEIKQSYDAWRFSREQNLALKEAVASAEENYQLQSEEYRRSLVNNLDVLAALQSLNNTRQNENQSFYQMKKDEARLKVAIGEVP